MTAVDFAPALGHGQDGLHLCRQEAVHRAAAGGLVDQGAHRAHPGPPAVHPVIGDAPQRAHPVVHEAVGHRLVDALEDQLLDLGGDPRREGSGQPQTAFPLATASSMAWALMASVSWPISARAASS